MRLSVNGHCMWHKSATSLKNALLKALSERFGVNEDDLTIENIQPHISLDGVYKLYKEGNDLSDLTRQRLLDYLNIVPGMSREQLRSGAFKEVVVDQHKHIVRNIAFDDATQD